MSRLSLYGRVAERASSVVIAEYSTSFGLATKLLAEPVRTHVENIYAYVRIADEIVDGAGAESGLPADRLGEALDAFEAQTTQALADGFSTNPVIHAFVLTANTVGFGNELITPFISSMRADLTETVHTPESFSEYVYGSAEVIGLMCLHAFLLGETRTETERETMVRGARALGAAFQKINFLRDLSDDYESLGRSYFPGVAIDEFSEADKTRLLDDIDRDLDFSAATLPLLPKSSRRAVALAQSLFTELTERIRKTPASQLLRARVSVPAATKAKLALEAYLGKVPKR
jgi:phytoene/squalene synthetase